MVVCGIVSGAAWDPISDGPWGNGVLLEDSHNNSAVYNVEKLGVRQPLERTFDYADGSEVVTLDAEVYAETGTVRVLVFSDSPDEPTVGRGSLGRVTSRRSSVGVDTDTSHFVASNKHTEKRMTSLSLQNMAVHVEHPGMSITLIGELPMCDCRGEKSWTPSEVLGVSVESIGVFSRAHEDALEFNVGRFQVDDMQHDVRFPMMVGPRGAASAPKMFSLKVFAVPGSNFLYYTLMRLELGEMRINCVVDTIVGMLSSLTVAIDAVQDQTSATLDKQAVEGICAICLEPPPPPKSSVSPVRLFFDNIEIVGSEAMESNRRRSVDAKQLLLHGGGGGGEENNRRLLPYDLRVRFTPPTEKKSLKMICGSTIGYIMEGVKKLILIKNTRFFDIFVLIRCWGYSRDSVVVQVLHSAECVSLANGVGSQDCHALHQEFAHSASSQSFAF
jgi:hypothetical protein